MPRQWFLKQLDPKGELSVPELRDLLRPHMLEYRAPVLLDIVEPRMTFKVRVPADLITATVSTRDRNLAIGGTAGRKRRRLEEERACNEKAIDSKVEYLRASAPAAPQRELVVPAADGVVMPSSDDDDFEVWPLVAAHRIYD
jgi:hypothetical protein